MPIEAEDKLNTPDGSLNEPSNEEAKQEPLTVDDIGDQEILTQPPYVAPAVVERTFLLDGAEYPLKRLGTRDGLSVAKTVLMYLSKMEDIFEEGTALQGLEGSEAIAAGLKFVEKLIPLLDVDDLVELGSRILGVPPEIVGAASAEDVLNAIADAFEVNDMPALLKAANRIWANLQKFGGGK